MRPSGHNSISGIAFKSGFSLFLASSFLFQSFVLSLSDLFRPPSWPSSLFGDHLLMISLFQLLLAESSLLALE